MTGMAKESSNVFFHYEFLYERGSSLRASLMAADVEISSCVSDILVDDGTAGILSISPGGGDILLAPCKYDTFSSNVQKQLQ